MTHVIESKHLKGIQGNLVITQESCVVQTIIDDTTLKEWIVPLFHRSPELSEVSVPIDSNILHNHEVLLIDKTHIHVDDISYPYKQGDIIGWETRLPELLAIIRVPIVSDGVKGLCTLWIKDGQLHIKTEDSIVYHYRLLYTFKDSTTCINGGVIRNIFNDHSGELCKIYMEEDFPVCLEFTNAFELKTRYYIAPCVPE